MIDPKKIRTSRIGNFLSVAVAQEHSMNEKQKKNFNELKKIAEKKGGKCLSKEYINAKSKLEWECEKGHRWESTPSSIQQGRWCPECSSKKKTIFDMQKLAEFNEGKCLSEKYINAKSKLEWECKKGHIWKATPSGIQQGHWCPKCRKKGRKRSKKPYIDHPSDYYSIFGNNFEDYGY